MEKDTGYENIKIHNKKWDNENDNFKYLQNVPYIDHNRHLNSLKV